MLYYWYTLKEKFMKFEIRYFITESSFRSGIPAFTEIINGDRNYAVNWANNKIRNSQFKYFDIIQK